MKPDDPLNLKGRKRKRILAGTLIIGTTLLSLYFNHKQITVGQQEQAGYYQRTYVDDSGVRKIEKMFLSTVVFLTSGTSFTRPVDWNNAANTVECIGGGAGGQTVSFVGCLGFQTGGGGGGGGYSKSSNLTLGATAAFTIGAGGAIATNGGATTFNSSAIVANGGTTGGAGSSSGGAGGTLGTGTTRFVGGAGGSGTLSSQAAGGAGGGAAGLHGAGNSGGNSNPCLGLTTTGGSGDNGSGGAGGSSGNGGNGTEYDASHGSGGGGASLSSTTAGNGGLYGGGGGGGGTVFISCSTTTQSPGTGSQGLIIITYTPVPAPAVTGRAPTSGTQSGGTSVALTGTNFTGVTTVKFGATAGTGLSVNSDSSITITSPAHAVGAVDITVTNPIGTSATGASDVFTFIATFVMHRFRHYLRR